MGNSYDLIFSLGGSCAVAKQMIFKWLRTESLPFDWVFHMENSTLDYLCKGFSGGFKEFLLEENLREVLPEEKGDSSHLQYKDILTGYYFIHDFDSASDYGTVREKYDRRIKRLETRLLEANSLLMILDARYQVNIDLLFRLRQVIFKKFSIPTIDVRLLQFNANKQETITLNTFYTNAKESNNPINRVLRFVKRREAIGLSPSGCLVVDYIPRNHTIDDYNAEPDCWNFLKNVSKNKANS